MKKKIAIILSACIISGAIVPTIGTAYALETSDTNNSIPQSDSETSSTFSDNIEDSEKNSTTVTDDTVLSSNISEENIGDEVEFTEEFSAELYAQNNSTERLHEEINLLEEGKYTIGNGSQVVDIYDTGYGDGVQAITYKATRDVYKRQLNRARNELTTNRR